MVISKLVHELNEDISDKEIRLIGSQGEQLGLDLVKISPQATPPVC